jgi:hypothetical protein
MGQGVSKEQIKRAKAVPMLDYLLSHEGNNFKRVLSEKTRKPSILTGLEKCIELAKSLAAPVKNRSRGGHEH